MCLHTRVHLSRAFFASFAHPCRLLVVRLSAGGSQLFTAPYQAWNTWWNHPPTVELSWYCSQIFPSVSLSTLYASGARCKPANLVPTLFFPTPEALQLAKAGHKEEVAKYAKISFSAPCIYTLKSNCKLTQNTSFTYSRVPCLCFFYVDYCRYRCMSILTTMNLLGGVVTAGCWFGPIWLPGLLCKC